MVLSPHLGEARLIFFYFNVAFGERAFADRLEIRLNSFTFSGTYLLCQNAMRLACAYFLRALIDKA